MDYEKLVMQDGDMPEGDAPEGDTPPTQPTEDGGMETPPNEDTTGN